MAAVVSQPSISKSTAAKAAAEASLGGEHAIGKTTVKLIIRTRKKKTKIDLKIKFARRAKTRRERYTTGRYA